MADCCVGAPVYHAGPPSSFLSDPCVCNADLGTVYVNTTNREVYIRTLNSVTCVGSDWETVTAIAGSGGSGNAATMPINLSAFPASCTGVVVTATVEGAIINLACAIRNPPLNIMSFSTTGIGCTPTATIPTNLQALFNFLICRDETILAKQLPWRINGQTTATVNSGATVNNWITHFGNVSIGVPQGILVNAKLEVEGNIISGDLASHTINSTNNNAVIGGASASMFSSSTNSVIIGGTSNKIGANNSAVIAGITNEISNGTGCLIAGAGNRTIFGESSSILAGQGNTITRGTAVSSTIIGDVIITGSNNVIQDESHNSAIIAGANHRIFGTSRALVGTGDTNQILAGSDNSGIVAGTLHTLAGTNNIIGAGNSNSIVNILSTNSGIFTGDTNKVERGTASAIIAGTTNIVGSASVATISSVIAGGTTNTITAGNNYSFIGAGTANQVTNNRAAILTGQGNTSSGQYGAVIAGVTNSASGLRAVIVAGLSNLCGGVNAGVLSGTLNAATGDNSAVVTGSSNAVASTATLSAVITGNTNNIATTSTRSLIGTGNNNSILAGTDSAILTGATNVINASTSCHISGGEGNQILTTSVRSAISSGTNNTITTGTDSAIIYGGSNIITGIQYALAGGLSSQALGAHTIALGRQAVGQAAHSGVFIWQSSNAANFNSAANNEFAIKPIGGVRIFTNAGSTTGMTMAAGGSSWVAVSSKKVKDEFTEINDTKFLERLNKIKVQTFKYKKEDKEDSELFDDTNIGTTAEEWNAAFGDLITPKMIQNVVEDENGNIVVKEIPGISQQDQIGVLLYMVKELAKEVQNLKAKSK